MRVAALGLHAGAGAVGTAVGAAVARARPQLRASAAAPGAVAAVLRRPGRSLPQDLGAMRKGPAGGIARDL